MESVKATVVNNNEPSIATATVVGDNEPSIATATVLPETQQINVIKYTSKGNMTNNYATGFQSEVSQVDVYYYLDPPNLRYDNSVLDKILKNIADQVRKNKTNPGATRENPYRITQAIHDDTKQKQDKDLAENQAKNDLIAQEDHANLLRLQKDKKDKLNNLIIGSGANYFDYIYTEWQKYKDKSRLDDQMAQFKSILDTIKIRYKKYQSDFDNQTYSNPNNRGIEDITIKGRTKQVPYVFGLSVKREYDPNTRILKPCMPVYMDGRSGVITDFAIPDESWQKALSDYRNWVRTNGSPRDQLTADDESVIRLITAERNCKGGLTGLFKRQQKITIPAIGGRRSSKKSRKGMIKGRKTNKKSTKRRRTLKRRK
jgi:membrane-bound inhibitor of C-type lysozyme